MAWFTGSSGKTDDEKQAERDMAAAAKNGDSKAWHEASDRKINAQWDNNPRLRDKGKEAR